MLNNLSCATNALKTGSKRVIKKKKQKQLLILLVVKLLIKLQKPKKITTKYFRGNLII